MKNGRAAPGPDVFKSYPRGGPVGEDDHNVGFDDRETRNRARRSVTVKSPSTSPVRGKPLVRTGDIEFGANTDASDKEAIAKEMNKAIAAYRSQQQQSAPQHTHPHPLPQAQAAGPEEEGAGGSAAPGGCPRV